MTHPVLIKMWLEGMYDHAIAEAQETIELEQVEVAQSDRNPSYKRFLEDNIENLQAYIVEIQKLKEALNGNG